MRQPTVEEIAALDRLEAARQIAELHLMTALAELRQLCGAPSWALLGEDRKTWAVLPGGDRDDGPRPAV